MRQDWGKTRHVAPRIQRPRLKKTAGNFCKCIQSTSAVMVSRDSTGFSNLVRVGLIARGRKYIAQRSASEDPLTRIFDYGYRTSTAVPSVNAPSAAKNWTCPWRSRRMGATCKWGNGGNRDGYGTSAPVANIQELLRFYICNDPYWSLLGTCGGTVDGGCPQALISMKQLTYKTSRSSHRISTFVLCIWYCENIITVCLPRDEYEYVEISRRNFGSIRVKVFDDHVFSRCPRPSGTTLDKSKTNEQRVDTYPMCIYSPIQKLGQSFCKLFVASVRIVEVRQWEKKFQPLRWTLMCLKLSTTAVDQYLNVQLLLFTFFCSSRTNVHFIY